MRNFRKLFRADRIVAADLEAVHSPNGRNSRLNGCWSRTGDRDIRRGEVLHIALVYGVEPLALNDLIWRIEELHGDPPVCRGCAGRCVSACWRAPAGKVVADSGATLEDLWRACLEGFQLPAFDLHPEELVDLQLNVAKSLLARFVRPMARRMPIRDPSSTSGCRPKPWRLLDRLFGDVGEKSTLARRCCGC
jgi:hypothetical protein